MDKGKIFTLIYLYPYNCWQGTSGGEMADQCQQDLFLYSLSAIRFSNTLCFFLLQPDHKCQQLVIYILHKQATFLHTWCTRM